jgi:mRNA interferase RelE/StbE
MGTLKGFAYSQAALRALERIATPKIRRQIKRHIDGLADNPMPQGVVMLKGNNGGEPVYRLRSGDYRVLYLVRENEIVIIDIDHRKDIYREW